MTIALLLMTDGRTEYIADTIFSAGNMLEGAFTEFWMHDDSGSEPHRQWLREKFVAFQHIGEGSRKGFGGAYQHAWKTLASQSQASYIFGLEDDFTFNRKIPLDHMIQVLEDNPNAYQMALRRQSWNNEERAAGGVIERWPDQFHQEDGWISHKLFFTTNPSLYRRSLIENYDYPNVKDAEGHFFLKLVKDNPDMVCGFWGDKTDSPWVEHIGYQRGKGTY